MGLGEKPPGSTSGIGSLDTGACAGSGSGCAAQVLASAENRIERIPRLTRDRTAVRPARAVLAGRTHGVFDEVKYHPACLARFRTCVTFWVFMIDTYRR